METPAELMRKHYPEFLKDLDIFKTVFGNIKREYIKCSVGEFGKKFEGAEINPVISDKISNGKQKRLGANKNGERRK